LLHLILGELQQVAANLDQEWAQYSGVPVYLPGFDSVPLDFTRARLAAEWHMLVRTAARHRGPARPSDGSRERPPAKDIHPIPTPQGRG
jgi:hypothetical protein